MGYWRKFIPVLLGIVSLCHLPGCASRHLPPSRYSVDNISLMRDQIDRYSRLIEAVRGRFSARLLKPGFDISFQGSFSMGTGGHSRIEVYNPFGTMSHLLDIQAGTFRYISESGVVQGNPFEPVAAIAEQWGLEIAPYQIFSLFSGPYSDPYFYKISEKLVREGPYYRLELNCLHAAANEYLIIDPVSGRATGRQVHLNSGEAGIDLAYSYRGPLVRTEDDLPDETCFPHRTVASQKHRHVRLEITLLDVVVTTQSIQ